MATVLIIDDNRAIGEALTVLLNLHGLRALSARSPAEGLAQLEREPVDLVIQDMNFTGNRTSGGEGAELFAEIRRRHPDLPIILLTAWTHLEHAVELVKAGAADYLAKPWDDAKLVTTVANLLQLGQLRREQRHSAQTREQQRRELAGRFDLCGIVYASDALQQVLAIATQIAHADVPVILTGANGAGKEKIADIIHANSPFRAGPYIKVNMGALPAELMESELFGAEAGAFTGAQKARAGRFEAADQGTLFLDEIGNLPPAGQIKLLRVLQTGEFERLGSSQTRRVRVRIVAATNGDLRAAIAAGSFREDLYYRLNVIEIHVPPLAERREDILPLARAFLGAAHQLSVEAEQVLLAHAWPGNVRELQNCMKRAALLAGGSVVTAEALGLPAARAASPAAAEPDAADIQAALARHQGVIASAAQDLGLSRQALYRRMEKFGIGKP
ncbi:MAG: sigma-54-dependent Fis family transcriptional regulator [Gammaproteobacteria bacterium]|nr:sigma-54-dependent Fis family transcriptional regulator [Gammaproteobacteria bacterium]